MGGLSHLLITIFWITTILLCFVILCYGAKIKGEKDREIYEKTLEELRKGGGKDA